MKTLKDAELFSIGLHNGKEFTGDDLDAIVANYKANGHEGRLPVKVGHNTPDSAEAEGRVTNLRRVGDKLIADLAYMSDAVMEKIGAKRIMDVSIELINSATGWVLDAVALLGAARPAVTGLKPLKLSALGERYCFARDPDPSAAEEVVQLRRQLLATVIENDVSSGKVLPKHRGAFLAQFGTDAPLESWHAFTASNREKPGNNKPTSRTGRASAATVEQDSLTSCEKFSAFVKEIQDEREESGKPITYEAATKIAMKKDPELFRTYVARRDFT